MLIPSQRETEALSAPLEPLLRIRGLRVEFPTALGDSRVAINDLDLDVDAGTIVGLVGESGAGKTTLARSILNHPPAPARITRGEVWFDGADFRQLPASAQRKRLGRDLSLVVPNPRGELNPLIPVGAQIANL